jgi:hypothetical protein
MIRTVAIGLPHVLLFLNFIRCQIKVQAFLNESTPQRKILGVRGGDFWESEVAMRNHPTRRGNRSFYRLDLEKRTLFFAIAYPSLKIIIRILMNNRIQPAQTIIHAIFLATPTRNMNKVNMIKNPRGSIILSGKIIRGNIG